MDTFAVPVVETPPEARHGDFVVACADYLLTSLCRAAPALLHAQWQRERAWADLLGRRRLFLVGLGVFTVSSLLSAMAGSGAALFAARAGQGILEVRPHRQGPRRPAAVAGVPEVA